MADLEQTYATVGHCLTCDFICSKPCDWNRHLLTRKHRLRTGITKLEQKPELACRHCKKHYIARNSLWYHEKKCVIPSQNIVLEPIVKENKDTEIKVLKNLVLEVVKNNTELQKQTNELQKQNQDFQLQMLEICKTSNNVNINTNSHNKTFNLQVFLNEECKDAMNLSDFIKSIVLHPNNLEDLGELGYVEGMSKIILKELSNTAQNKRPVHCSDIKRETLYVKEENKWEKEGPENLRLKYAIRDIEKKNMGVLMNEWKAEHPDHKNGDSNENNIYMKLVKEIMNGSAENINKVIWRLAKEVVIEK
jgi:hypothetical protein